MSAYLCRVFNRLMSYPAISLCIVCALRVFESWKEFIPYFFVIWFNKFSRCLLVTASSKHLGGTTGTNRTPPIGEVENLWCAGEPESHQTHPGCEAERIRTWLIQGTNSGNSSTFTYSYYFQSKREQFPPELCSCAHLCTWKETRRWSISPPNTKEWQQGASQLQTTYGVQLPVRAPCLCVGRTPSLPPPRWTATARRQRALPGLRRKPTVAGKMSASPPPSATPCRKCWRATTGHWCPFRLKGTEGRRANLTSNGPWTRLWFGRKRRARGWRTSILICTTQSSARLWANCGGGYRVTPEYHHKIAIVEIIGRLRWVKNLIVPSKG